MLEFVNKRTGKDVIYKPTFFTMVYTLSIFITVAITGVLLYTKLHSFWMKWQVWFIGSLVNILLSRLYTSHAFLGLFMILFMMFLLSSEIMMETFNYFLEV
jgi:hypothetical protein